MLANYAGAQPILFRSGIGVGGMRPMIIVVHSVPGVVFTIRVRIFVSRTTIMLTNTAGTLPRIFRAEIGKGRVVIAIMIVDQSVPRFMSWGFGLGFHLVVAEYHNIPPIKNMSTPLKHEPFLFIALYYTAPYQLLALMFCAPVLVIHTFWAWAWLGHTFAWLGLGLDWDWTS